MRVFRFIVSLNRLVGQVAQAASQGSGKRTGIFRCHDLCVVGIVAASPAFDGAG